MKQAVTCAILLFLTANLFAQRINRPHQLTRAEYLQKSKQQRKAASVLAAGGAMVATGGAILELKDFFEVNPGAVELMLIGAASMVGSIPLFIAANRNNRKALNVTTSLQILRTPVITQTTPTLYRSVGLSLKFTF